MESRGNQLLALVAGLLMVAGITQLWLSDHIQVSKNTQAVCQADMNSRQNTVLQVNLQNSQWIWIRCKRT